MLAYVSVLCSTQHHCASEPAASNLPKAELTDGHCTRGSKSSVDVREALKLQNNKYPSPELSFLILQK